MGFPWCEVSDARRTAGFPGRAQVVKRLSFTGRPQPEPPPRPGKTLCSCEAVRKIAARGNFPEEVTGVLRTTAFVLLATDDYCRWINRLSSTLGNFLESPAGDALVQRMRAAVVPAVRLAAQVISVHRAPTCHRPAVELPGEPHFRRSAHLQCCAGRGNRDGCAASSPRWEISSRSAISRSGWVRLAEQGWPGGASQTGQGLG